MHEPPARCDLIMFWDVGEKNGLEVNRVRGTLDFVSLAGSSVPHRDCLMTATEGKEGSTRVCRV